MGKYDVNAIRQKLKQSMSGKFDDPDAFKPKAADSTTEPIKYRFFILPPLFKGDQLKSGTVARSMDQFFISHANHWVNNRPHPCPRVWDNNECKICQFGFDLLKEDENQWDEDKRRQVIRQWMPTTYHLVNIFFTGWKGNPEDLRGKVKVYNAAKTLFDQWTTTLMRDDMGDPEDPQAFGVFFDENAGFVYELQVLKQGRQNSYKTSKFLSNGGQPVSMIKNKDGSSNEEMLVKLLSRRHNLWSKIEIPDQQKIDAIYNSMINGDDGDDGFDKDDTHDLKTEKSTAGADAIKAQKAQINGDDDGDNIIVDDDITNEVPLVEADPEKTTTDDVDSDEIDDLLSQLDDD